MLISEFSRESGLTPDTIRFYVRKGLLTPEAGDKGGSNPYQIFTTEHVENARIIRMAQSLGFSLNEIGALADEYRAGGVTPERSAEIMRAQLARLREKADQVAGMVAYVSAKLEWLETGSEGPEPRFGDVVCGESIRTAERVATEQKGRNATGRQAARRSAPVVYRTRSM